MTDDLRKFLSTFSVFDVQEIEAVIGSMKIETHAKGTLLLREGEITSRCYFILKGCIREYQLQDGVEKSTAFFTEHQAVISYTSYLEQAPSHTILVSKIVPCWWAHAKASWHCIDYIRVLSFLRKLFCKRIISKFNVSWPS